MDSSHVIISDNNQNLGFMLDAKQKLQLILPKFYQNQEIPNVQEETLTFYQLLKKYSRENINNRSIKEKDAFQQYVPILQDSKENASYFFLNIYFSLLEDFQKNRLLRFHQYCTNKLPQGRINWAYTSKITNEIISQDQVFYEHFYHDNIQHNFQHPITLLYALAISKISEAIDLKVNLPYSPSLLDKFESQKKLIPYYLKIYKSQMFSDRERFVFNHLEQFFGANRFVNYLNQPDRPLIYVERLDMIWEKMLAYCLNFNRETLSLNLPKGSYKMAFQDNKAMSGLNLIPDLIISHRYEGEEYILIIDAKNYVPDFERGIGLPGSGDILKQACYKYLLTSNFDNRQQYKAEQIINIFVLPYLTENGETMRYLGKHSLDNPFGESNFADILCVQLDFKKLRDVYLRPNAEYGTSVLDHLTQIYLENRTLFS